LISFCSPFLKDESVVDTIVAIPFEIKLQYKDSAQNLNKEIFWAFFGHFMGTLSEIH
jgi:hypothetical protein